MICSITFPARALDAETYEPIIGFRLKKKITLHEPEIGVHLDGELADIGVDGANIEIRQKFLGLTLTFSYTVPNRLSRGHRTALIKDTTGQLSDGIGEDGFDCRVGDRDVLIEGNWRVKPRLRYRKSDEIVPPVNHLAIFARDRRVEELLSELESISADALERDLARQHQVYTPLVYAVDSGLTEPVAALLTAGANPNGTDFLGDCPLDTCVLNNCLSDEQSLEIFKLLVDAGADWKLMQYDALDMAVNRKKLKLASYLEELVRS